MSVYRGQNAAFIDQVIRSDNRKKLAAKKRSSIKSSTPKYRVIPKDELIDRLTYDLSKLK